MMGFLSGRGVVATADELGSEMITDIGVGSSIGTSSLRVPSRLRLETYSGKIDSHSKTKSALRFYLNTIVFRVHTSSTSNSSFCMDLHSSISGASSSAVAIVEWII